MSLWARESASRTAKPNSRSMAATALLPLAIPPVRPSRSMMVNYRAVAVDCVADDFGAAKNIGQVARLGMANGDGGVGVHQQQGHGLADDVAAPEDYGVCAFNLDIVAAQHFHAPRGSAGDQAGASAD